MEFLVTLVAAPLNKALEVCFLTGFVTAYKLETSKYLKGGVLTLPGWHRRKARRHIRRNSSGFVRVSRMIPAHCPC